MKDDDKKKREAYRLIEEGQAYVAQKRYSDAQKKFQESVDLYPTADGYTFLAWMYSFDGRYKEAIELCKKAIEIDPDYGNSYNDIGCYLIQLQKEQDSIPWFEMAKKSKRYKPRHFPYLNLARLYLRKEEIPKAKQEFSGVLQFDPQNVEARFVLELLDDSKENKTARFSHLFSSN